ncbi:MAG: hypothetical protein EXR00_05565 [Alphaproteobacteria bacterium]|nr:hypothetical protein [Alphaproteobacteria bacterium]
MKYGLPVLVAVLASAGANSAAAHHSFSMYDRYRTVTLSGTVKEYIWTSPHVTIQLLRNAGRGPVVWTVEGSSPTVLARGGWTSTVMKPGDRISLGLHPRKDGSAGGLLADEQQLLVNGHPAKGVLWLRQHGEELNEMTIRQ